MRLDAKTMLWMFRYMISWGMNLFPGYRLGIAINNKWGTRHVKKARLTFAILGFLGGFMSLLAAIINHWPF